MLAFEVLLELLDVHPHLSGGSPLTVRATSRGGKVSLGTTLTLTLHVTLTGRCTFILSEARYACYLTWWVLLSYTMRNWRFRSDIFSSAAQ